MRRLIAALALFATPALADDTTTSAMIASEGLTRTAAQLETQPPSPDRDMALAATRFLGGIQTAYQTRWRIGFTDPLLPVPVLGTPLPQNPQPQPMQPDTITELARELDSAMQTTREALSGEDAALILDLNDLWFDVKTNGSRDPGEDLLTLIGLPLPEGAGTQIRFDGSDRHWLDAYTRLIQTATAMVLAFDPEPVLERRQAETLQWLEQFAEPPGQMARAPRYYREADAYGPILDLVYSVVEILRQQPDAAKVAEARDHAAAMIAANRAFWQAVAAEQDNDREWIPNDAQTAALGFDIPQGAGAAWLGVLDDAEALLEGRMLVPHWRFAPGYGIDLPAWLDDPQPVDLLGWLQGSDALAYAKPGLTVGYDKLESFTDMFSGRAGLYMVLFN